MVSFTNTSLDLRVIVAILVLQDRWVTFPSAQQQLLFYNPLFIQYIFCQFLLSKCDYWPSWPQSSLCNWWSNIWNITVNLSFLTFLLWPVVKCVTFLQAFDDYFTILSLSRSLSTAPSQLFFSIVYVLKRGHILCRMSNKGRKNQDNHVKLESTDLRQTAHLPTYCEAVE